LFRSDRRPPEGDTTSTCCPIDRHAGNRFALGAALLGSKLNVAAVALLVALLAWLGLQPRINEYRF
jgi:hypothetical protein